MEDLTDLISNQVKKCLLESQNYQCARKPYSSIPKLEKYRCLLWKRTKFPGRLENKQYHVVKMTESGSSNQNNLIILCPSCFRVRYNRCHRKIKEPTNSDTDDETNVESNAEIPDAIEEDICEYRVVYYRDKTNQINDHMGDLEIREKPSFDSLIIGYVYYGDVLEGQSNDNLWIQISYGDIVGYIPKYHNEWILLEKIEENMPLLEKSAELLEENVVSSGDCAICFNKIIDKYVIIPCGHTRICGTCCKNISLCPFCRIKVDKCIRYYD